MSTNVIGHRGRAQTNSVATPNETASPFSLFPVEEVALVHHPNFVNSASANHHGAGCRTSCFRDVIELASVVFAQTVMKEVGRFQVKPSPCVPDTSRESVDD